MKARAYSNYSEWRSFAKIDSLAFTSFCIGIDSVAFTSFCIGIWQTSIFLCVIEVIRACVCLKGYMPTCALVRIRG